MIGREAKPMVDRSDFITVICDNCGEEFKEQIARLDSVAIYLCPHCRTPLEPDAHELQRLISEEVEHDSAYLRLYAVEG